MRQADQAKERRRAALRVYIPAKPFVYDGYEYRIKPAYLGGYLVSIDGGEYRSMGDTHNHAALLAREAIDVCNGHNLDLIRAGGEGMVSFEIMSEATKPAKRVKVVKPVPAQDPVPKQGPEPDPVAPSKTESLSGRVSRLSIELAALKQLLENAETSELADMQAQLFELGNHAKVISALCKRVLGYLNPLHEKIAFAKADVTLSAVESGQLDKLFRDADECQY